jgi:hypothetical protein
VVVKGGVVDKVVPGRGVVLVGELPTVGVFGIPSVGLVVGDGRLVVGGKDGKASGERVGEGDG